MKITDKITNSRYVLKEILNNEWDTSDIADLSSNDIEKIYTGLNPTDQYIKAYGCGFVCNIKLKHKIIDGYNLHIIYYNFTELSPIQQIHKVTKQIVDKLEKLYESEYLGSNDSIMVILNEPISESIEKKGNELNFQVK